MIRRRSMIAGRPVALAAALVVIAACGSVDGPTGTTPATSDASGGAAPAFELALDGVVGLPAYASDAAASLNECAPAASGGWTYLYAGGTPFLTLDLSVYSGVMTGTDPADFDLDIVAPGGRAVRVVPSGRREGAQGDGAIELATLADGGVRIDLDGEAITLEGGPTSLGSTRVHLDLRCPAEP
jgi:hypothetical protein